MRRKAKSVIFEIGEKELDGKDWEGRICGTESEKSKEVKDVSGSEKESCVKEDVEKGGEDEVVI